MQKGLENACKMQCRRGVRRVQAINAIEYESSVIYITVFVLGTIKKQALTIISTSISAIREEKI